MKGRIFLVVLLVCVAAVAGRWVTKWRSPHVSKQEETRQAGRLDAGARVEVSGINGPVEIRTSDTDAAEVRVVRTADDAGDLEYNKVVVEVTASGVVVRGENNGARGFWRWLWGGGTGHVKQEVTLDVPRRVEVLTKGVNGSVRVGEVEGSVAVEGVNGRVEVAQSLGRSEIKGVNGGVGVGVAQLGPQGMEIKGVNGNVEIRFKENVNADINVKGQNGGLALNVPNVTMQERESFSNMRARLGAGGSPIEIKGVNGNVRFESDAPATTTSVAPGVNTSAPVTSGPTVGPNAPAPPPPPGH
jgi:hypothetical protein